MSMGAPSLPPPAPPPPNPASLADPAAQMASAKASGSGFGLSSTYMTTGAAGDPSTGTGRKTLLGS